MPLLVVVLAFTLMQWPKMGKRSNPAIGKTAPQIDLIRLGLDARSDRIERIETGQVTLIHFWGTWCGPCKIEYPELDAVVRELENVDRFRFLPVSCEGSSYETVEGLAKKTAEYLQTGNLDPLAYADPQGITRRSVAERLEMSSIFYPTSILIGADGKIADVWLGYTPESVGQIESQLRKRLSTD